MKINKTIKGESFRYYVQFIYKESKAKVRYFQSDEWIICDISDDCKYIILPATFMSQSLWNSDKVKVGRLTIPKHERRDLIDFKNNLNNKMKTHKVLDLVYTPDEGQDDFVGTHQECQDYISQQCQGSVSSMYKIVPMTKEEMLICNK